VAERVFKVAASHQEKGDRQFSLHCPIIMLLIVTGCNGKSWNLKFKFSTPGKSWNYA